MRESRKIKIRPFPESGMKKMTQWFIDETFETVYSAVSAHKKAEIFQHMLLKKLDEFFPLKERKINSDDQPWISFQVKKLDRKRKREYKKNRRSEKWKALNKLFKKEVKIAKNDFYKSKIAHLKEQKPSKYIPASSRTLHLINTREMKLQWMKSINSQINNNQKS